MSIVNLWVYPERAVVCSDSIVGQPGRQTFHQVSKMIALPHARCVIAMRGWFDMYRNVVANAIGGSEGFDALSERMPEVLVTVHAQTHIRAAKLVEPNRAHMALTIALVGWSEQQGCMSAVRYEIAASGELKQLAVAWSYAPAVTGFQHDGSDASMIELAKTQVHQAREADPNCPIGGRLQCAEITRTSITIRQLCDLG